MPPAKNPTPPRRLKLGAALDVVPEGLRGSAWWIYVGALHAVQGRPARHQLGGLRALNASELSVLHTVVMASRAEGCYQRGIMHLAIDAGVNRRTAQRAVAELIARQLLQEVAPLPPSPGLPTRLGAIEGAVQ